MDDVNKQDGLVVWYNERKGYGFVHIGEDEIFLHHSALDRFGLVSVFPGDRLAVVITENERGSVIREILSIQRAQADSVPKNTAPGQDEVQGIVEFFNTFKGYGFIEVGQDQQDVFVHLRTLRSCGIHNLIQGQELLLNITDEGKGPQATEIRLLSSE